jgi:hypothetical protein
MGLFSGIINDVKNVIGLGPKKRPATTTVTTTQSQAQAPTVNLNAPLQKVNGGYNQPTNNTGQTGIANQPVINLTQLNPNALVKAKPIVAAPATTTNSTTVAPAQHQSILSNVTHAVGSVAKSAATQFINTGEDVSNTIGTGEVDLGNALGIKTVSGAKPVVQTNQQQFGAINNALGVKTQSNTVKNFALNAGQVGLDVLAPGVDSAAETVIRAVAPDLAENLVKVAAKPVTGAVIGGLTNTAQAVENGDSLGKVAKSGLEGVGIGGVLGGVGGAATPLLRKIGSVITPGADADAASAATVTQPDEVAPGVKTNPNNEPVTDNQPAPAPPEQPAAVSVTGPNGETVPQVSAESPNAKAPQIPVDDNTPAFLRGKPTTVGEAQLQASHGVNNFDDSTFDADARTNNESLDPSDPNLDIPSFIRNNPQAAESAALQRLAEADQKIALVGKNSGRVGDFNDKQDIAAAYKISAQKGQATAKLIAARNLRNDPEAAIKALTVEKNQAQQDLNLAQRAKTAISEPTDIPAQAPPVPEVTGPNGEQVPQISADVPNADAPQLKVDAPAPEPAQPLEVKPGEMNADEQAALKQLNASGKTKALTPEELTMKNALQAKSDAIQAANDPSTPPAATIQPAAPAQDLQAPADAATVASAPKVAQAASKQMHDISDEIGANPKTHQVFGNKLLTDAANKFSGASSDSDLISQYSNPVKFSSASDMAKANVAMQRIAASPASEARTNALVNITNGLTEHASGLGSQFNYLKEIYGNLPKEAKIPILTKQIDAARAQAGLPLAADNKPLEAEINAKLDNLLTTDENIKGSRAAIQSQLQTARDNLDPNAPLSKADAGDLVNQGTQAGSDLQDLDNQAQANQGELARYVTEIGGKPKGTGVMSKLSGAAKNAAELQKSLLLASVSGPLNDSTLSTVNAARELGNSTVSSVAGKVLNKVTGSPGKYISKLPSLKTLVSGNNLTKTVGEMKGNLYTPDALDTLTAKTGTGRTGLLQKANDSLLTKFNAKVHATREAATNLTAGMKDVKIQQLADQEGRQAGFTGPTLKAYTALRTPDPTGSMDAVGEQLRQEVNNMNDNPLSRALGSHGGGLSKLPIVGPLAQNLFQPFSQWVGAQGWNAITDQNVAANLAKTVGAAAKGDQQGVLDNVSKLAVNAGGGITAGYGLAKAGILTTGHGSSTSNSNGLSLHIGNNYIPVTFLGGAAPSLIMGYSAYNGMHSNPNGSMADHISQIAAGTLGTTFKEYAEGTPLAGDNSVFGPYGIATQVGQALNPSSTGAPVTGKDILSNLGTDEASEFIPGAASNANAVLNQTGADPSHSAPETTVKTLNAKTGNMDDNPIASNTAYLESRIPGISQGMPRNLAKAAPTFMSEYDRGSNDGKTQLVKAAATTANTKSVQSQIAAGVPIYDPAKGTAPKGYSFDNTLDTAIQTGNYSNAITGLQSKLKSLNTPGPAHIPPETRQAVSDHITQLKVLQAQKVTPDDMNTYATTTLSQWRDLGNPASSEYNPALYQKLYSLDQQLAANGVSGGSLDAAGKKSTAKFYTTATADSESGKAASSSSSKAATAAADLIKNNTLGSAPNLPNFTYGSLTPEKISTTIPQIQDLSPSTLIKKRAISVSSSQ